MQIFVIRDAAGCFTARAFDAGRLNFLSARADTVQIAVAEVQEWAVLNFGEELSVASAIEFLPRRQPRPGTEEPPSPAGRRVKNWMGKK